jgi:hypothetical protein
MWWRESALPGVKRLMPSHVLEMLVRAYAIVEVGGIGGVGPERGRRFEQLFYKMCDRRGLHFTEKAGSRSITGQRTASGFLHEIDAASRAAIASTCWELKHLTVPLEKNELLIFNGKALDYLYDAGPLFRNTPLLRFLLSGQNIRDEGRIFAIQWGITIIEPSRFPLPLIYEAVARGFARGISKPDYDAVMLLCPWACRSLQTVVWDVATRCREDNGLSSALISVQRRAKETIDLQEQIGMDVLDELEDQHADWVNNLAHDIWAEVGGWI